jgi:hypothetical protein
LENGFDRKIADLFFDNGTLWAVAASDPEGAHLLKDKGPFHSLVYAAASFDPNGMVPLKFLSPDGKPQWTIEGIKVEALCNFRNGPGASHFCIASDDEKLGGMWRILRMKAPAGK